MSSCSNVCGSRQAQAAAEGGYQRYGVRSYLHQFYEDCTASMWEYEDDFQIQRSPNRWSSVFWKQELGFHTSSHSQEWNRKSQHKNCPRCCFGSLSPPGEALLCHHWNWPSHPKTPGCSAEPEGGPSQCTPTLLYGPQQGCFASSEP
uniref:Neurensin 1 n=1 Tax=Aotus nancymaae TaxID=37293 RepID=A0A2K5DI99_AOTNA